MPGSVRKRKLEGSGPYERPWPRAAEHLERRAEARAREADHRAEATRQVAGPEQDHPLVRGRGVHPSRRMTSSPSSSAGGVTVWLVPSGQSTSIVSMRPSSPRPKVRGSSDWER